MQRAFRSICSEDGFDEYLEATLQRINDIESLERTREVVAKDLILGGQYKILQKDGKTKGEKVIEVRLETKSEEGDGSG
jgi:hypothetical protein